MLQRFLFSECYNDPFFQECYNDPFFRECYKDSFFREGYLRSLLYPNPVFAIIAYVKVVYIYNLNVII